MDNKRKQLILATTADDRGKYYYSGPIDGIWGKQSQEAAERFLADFAGEPAAGKNTTSKTDFWDEIEFFSREEFRCKCGGLYCQGFPAEPDEKMVRYADEIRKRLGVPVRVNSGLRCKVWNDRTPDASKTSKHMLGSAVDLEKPAGVTTEKMASVAEEVMGNTGGLGIYSWGIHIDSRAEKARWKG